MSEIRFFNTNNEQDFPVKKEHPVDQFISQADFFFRLALRNLEKGNLAAADGFLSEAKQLLRQLHGSSIKGMDCIKVLLVEAGIFIAKKEHQKAYRLLDQIEKYAKDKKHYLELLKLARCLRYKDGQCGRVALLKALGLESDKPTTPTVNVS